MSTSQITWDEPGASPGTAQPAVKWDEEKKPGLLDRTDSAITSALAPNPKNLQLPRTVGQAITRIPELDPEVYKTFGREAYSAGKSLIGAPSAIYHSFADPATEEETKEAGGPDQVSGAKRIGLGIGRMTAAPIVHAAQDYASGRVTPEAALSVAPEAIGQGAGTVVGGKLTEMAVPRIASAVKPAVAPVVRGLAKTANAGIKRAPIVAGAALGGAVGHELGMPGIGASVGASVGSQFPLKFRIPGEEFGLPKPTFPGAHLPEHPGVFPGATEPTATPEQLNPALISESRSLPGQIGKEVIRPKVAAIARPEPIPPRAGLTLPAAPDAVEATPAKVPSPSETARNAKAPLTNLGQQLNDALGGKPLEQGISLRNQRPQTNLAQQLKDAGGIAAKPTPRAPLTDLQGQIADAGKPPLPKDFTPVDSSALRGYKYDPDAQHFEVITNTGERFGRIGITPDQVEAFEKSTSKGRAWPALKNAPGAIPTKNGAPRTVQTSYRSASPDDIGEAQAETAKPIAKPSATKSTRSAKGKIASPSASRATAPLGSDEGDLTATWQQSVDHVNAQKGGVKTTVAPADLAKRWGVDESSIADTDANVRGLNAKQSQAYINKLAKSYKQGQPVEPVLETRDAENNITSVDGRHRALAAQKAGVERIPIIVRRVQ